jgi:glucose-6-phosphate isomerase
MAAQIVALAYGNDDGYKGGRPSNIITLADMDAYHLGCLLALCEHTVFVEGIIWDVNSFDQPGVELGKKLAKSISETNKKGMVEDMAELLFEKLI